ncbi:hypothetical protein AB0E82_01920 [Streptomyces anulatus]|uniref:hypothetical protein n=1 Tax=Streptomyces anulatus TaxID=1892 RepID=UPI0033EFCBF2
MPATPDRPADQLRAAAERRTTWPTAAPLQQAADLRRAAGDPLLANWLDATANALAWLAPYRDNEPGYGMWEAALAVARQFLGTTQCGECRDTGACNGGPCPLLTAEEAREPSADRRDRYAAAMALRDGHPEWPVRYEDDEQDYRRRADAVMAVADAEQASLRAEAEGLDEALRGAISASEKDGARLRAELAVAAPPAPADRAAEVEDLRAELDKLIRWHKEDGAQAVKAATTIKRLRAERAELSRQLDCLRGDMRDMETSLREQDGEFERIRRAAGEAAAGAHHPTEAHPPSVEYIAEVLELDGAWEYLGAHADPAVATRRRASITRRHPDAETRTVRKTTTYIVESDTVVSGVTP